MNIYQRNLFLAATATVVLACLPAQGARPQANIILILADDLGWADTTLYGKTSLYETPNIERLAARGMTFSNAYASPICSPTRASIMTGQNPARIGMTAPAAHLEAERFEATASENGPPHQKSTNVKSATRLDPSLPTLGKVLKGAGYATAHFGKWHLGREPHSPLELGFDVDTPHWYGPGPKTRLCRKTLIVHESKVSVDEGHLDHAREILSGLFEPREDASAFFQPTDQSFDDVALAICAPIELHGTSTAVFVFLGRNHRDDV